LLQANRASLRFIVDIFFNLLRDFCKDRPIVNVSSFDIDSEYDRLLILAIWQYIKTFYLMIKWNMIELSDSLYNYMNFITFFYLFQFIGSKTRQSNVRQNKSSGTARTLTPLSYPDKVQIKLVCYNTVHTSKKKSL